MTALVESLRVLPEKALDHDDDPIADLIIGIGRSVAIARRDNLFYGQIKVEAQVEVKETLADVALRRFGQRFREGATRSAWPSCRVY